MKKLIFGFTCLILLFSLISSVIAITGAIGNARMILKAEVGDKLKKSILVKNINDIPVRINLEADGDLKDDIDLEYTEFVLQPNEDKKAYFTIKARNPGNYESKINVQFTPEDPNSENKNGVGLSSTIILNVLNKGELPDDFDDNNDLNDNNNDNSGISSNTIANIINVENNAGTGMLPSIIISLTVTLILIVLLAILLMMYKNKFSKK